MHVTDMFKTSVTILTFEVGLLFINIIHFSLHSIEESGETFSLGRAFWFK